MDQTDLVNALVELTGSLRPGPSTSEADLQAARHAVARALAGGQPTDSAYAGAVSTPVRLRATPLPSASDFRTEMQKLAASVMPTPGTPAADTPAPFALFRTTPILAAFDPN